MEKDLIIQKLVKIAKTQQILLKKLAVQNIDKKYISLKDHSLEDIDVNSIPDVDKNSPDYYLLRDEEDYGTGFIHPKNRDGFVGTPRWHSTNELDTAYDNERVPWFYDEYENDKLLQEEVGELVDPDDHHAIKPEETKINKLRKELKRLQNMDKEEVPYYEHETGSDIDSEKAYLKEQIRIQEKLKLANRILLNIFKT